MSEGARDLLEVFASILMVLGLTIFFMLVIEKVMW